MNLYLVELYDTAEGIRYTEVVRAFSLKDAAKVSGMNAVEKGGLPDEGDWFDMSVAELFVPEGEGVYEEILAGNYRVIRKGDRCVVEVMP